MNAKSAFDMIGRELNIQKYADESEEGFHVRVAYSAMGFWSRMLASTQNKGEKGILKSTFHRKISAIIQNYVEMDNYLNDWFYPSENSNPENILRDTFLRMGDIVEFGFDGKICCAPRKSIQLLDGLSINQGYVQADENDFVSGLACVCREDTVATAIMNAEFGIPIYNADELIRTLHKKNKWEAIEDIDNYEIFDPSRNKVLSACWTKYLPLVSSQIYMARRQYSFGVYDYLFIKQVEDRYYVASISNFSQNELVRDTQRILYAFKDVYGKRATAVIEQGMEYSVVHFWSKLPPAEECLLRYIGWPLENIENPKNEYIVRNEFMDCVKWVAKNLAIEMEIHAYE